MEAKANIELEMEKGQHDEPERRSDTFWFVRSTDIIFFKLIIYINIFNEF